MTSVRRLQLQHQHAHAIEAAVHRLANLTIPNPSPRCTTYAPNAPFTPSPVNKVMRASSSMRKHANSSQEANLPHQAGFWAYPRSSIDRGAKVCLSWVTNCNLIYAVALHVRHVSVVLLNAITCKRESDGIGSVATRRRLYRGVIS